MRSFNAVALILTLSAGISLGQEADGGNVAVNSPAVQETAPALENQPGECGLPRWLLGFTASNLEFKSWPGTVSLQRRIGQFNYLGLGLSGGHQQWGPNEDTDLWPVGTATDTVYAKSRSRQWNFTVAPELSRVVRQGRNWLLLLGAEASFGVSKNFSASENRHTGSYYQYYSSTSESFNYSLGLGLPAALERKFSVRGQKLSLGVRGYLVKAETQRWVGESWLVSDSEYSGYSTDHDRDESTMPWNIAYKNPFQGGMQVQLKYWF